MWVRYEKANVFFFFMFVTWLYIYIHNIHKNNNTSLYKYNKFVEYPLFFFFIETNIDLQNKILEKFSSLTLYIYIIFLIDRYIVKKGEGGFESHTLLRMTTEWNGVGLGVASQSLPCPLFEMMKICMEKVFGLEEISSNSLDGS